MHKSLLFGAVHDCEMCALLIFFEILFRHVVLRDFMRADLAFIGVRDILDALDDFGLERVSFFEQFVDTL